MVAIVVFSDKLKENHGKDIAAIYLNHILCIAIYMLYETKMKWSDTVFYLKEVFRIIFNLYGFIHTLLHLYLT